MVYFYLAALSSMYITYNKPMPYGHAYENYDLRKIVLQSIKCKLTFKCRIVASSTMLTLWGMYCFP